MNAVVESLKKTPHGVLPANRIQCQLSTRVEDLQKLGQCVAVLTAAEPDAPSTVTFQWALAIKVHDYRGSEQLVERARSVGVAPETVERMQRVTWSEEPFSRRLVTDRRVRVPAVVFAFALLGAVFSLLAGRRRTALLAG